MLLVFVRYTEYDRYCASKLSVSESAIVIVNCPLNEGVVVYFIVPMYFFNNTLSSVNTSTYGVYVLSMDTGF